MSELREGELCVRSVKKGEQNSGHQLPPTGEAAEQIATETAPDRECSAWGFARESACLLPAPAQWHSHLPGFTFTGPPVGVQCMKPCVGPCIPGTVFTCLLPAPEKVLYGMILGTCILLLRPQVTHLALSPETGQGTAPRGLGQARTCLSGLRNCQQSHPVTELEDLISSFCKVGLITLPANDAGLW